MLKHLIVPATIHFLKYKLFLKSHILQSCVSEDFVELLKQKELCMLEFQDENQSVMDVPEGICHDQYKAEETTQQKESPRKGDLC